MARSTNSWAGVPLAIAALVHGAIFLVWQGSDFLKFEAIGANQRAAPAEQEGGLVDVPLATVSLVALPPQQLPESTPGAGDLWSDEDGNGGPSALVAPGLRSGRRAPGIRGIATASDRNDSAARSGGLWNHLLETQAMRATRAPRGRTTPESIERAAHVGHANRRIARGTSRRGDNEKRVGHDEGLGTGGAPGSEGREWLDADPRFDSAPKRSEKKMVAAVRPNSEAPLRAQGDTSSENSRAGEVRQWASAAALSSRKRSSPFDLGAPSAGGVSELGAGGRAGESVASQGETGRAATNGSEPVASVGPTHATRSNPYFYAMYRRIDKELVFPRKLALELEQGEVLLRFRLDAEGKVHGLKVEKRSGFREFDAEALRAFRAAGAFGPVPKPLLAGRTSLNVIAPYYFRNPLIR